MKKINSIGYGDKILGCAVFFTLLIPAGIQTASAFYKSELLFTCAKVSFGIGILIILLFTALLTVEFRQDKRITLYFKTQKNQRLHLGKNLYECQNCGNRSIKSQDKICCVCGILFKGKGE